MKTRGQGNIGNILNIDIRDAADNSINEIRERCNWYARQPGTCHVIRWIKKDGTMEIEVSCKWPSDYQWLLTKDWINIEENSQFWEPIKSYNSLQPQDSRFNQNFFSEISGYLQHGYENFFKEDATAIDNLFPCSSKKTQEKIKNSLSEFEMGIFNHSVVSHDEDLLKKLKNVKLCLLMKDQQRFNLQKASQALEELESLINLKYPYSNVARAFYVFCGFVIGGIGTQYLGPAAASVALAPWMVGALAGSAIVCVLLLAYHAYTYRSTSELGMFKNALDKGLVFCSAFESAMKAQGSY
jgi:hypothetical protein